MIISLVVAAVVGIIVYVFVKVRLVSTVVVTKDEVSRF